MGHDLSMLRSCPIAYIQICDHENGACMRRPCWASNDLPEPGFTPPHAWAHRKQMVGGPPPRHNASYMIRMCFVGCVHVNYLLTCMHAVWVRICCRVQVEKAT